MKIQKIKNFIIDVDGTLSNDFFIYSKNGKQYKLFGPDDSDALNILKKYLKINFISADKRGFPITKKRINDMGFQVDLVGKKKTRLNWLQENYSLDNSIYMGDSFTDIPIFQKIKYSITPANSFYLCKKFSNYTTKHNSASRSVAEACDHILNKFFKTSLLKEIQIS
jgi:3-deoxy-D-manno-octulosonate 8-phosphate phosphatase (KDO 8-P phosphatase)